jgi:hypothetical protein
MNQEESEEGGTPPAPLGHKYEKSCQSGATRTVMNPTRAFDELDFAD